MDTNAPYAASLPSPPPHRLRSSRRNCPGRDPRWIRSTTPRSRARHRWSCHPASSHRQTCPRRHMPGGCWLPAQTYPTSQRLNTCSTARPLLRMSSERRRPKCENAQHGSARKSSQKNQCPGGTPQNCANGSQPKGPLRRGKTRKVSICLPRTCLPIFSPTIRSRDPRQFGNAAKNKRAKKKPGRNRTAARKAYSLLLYR